MSLKESGEGHIRGLGEKNRKGKIHIIIAKVKCQNQK